MGDMKKKFLNIEYFEISLTNEHIFETITA